jgi:hypothetical protein
MNRLLLILILLPSFAAMAQVYEIKDASGRIIGYSDSPPQGDNTAEKIQLRQTNSSAPPPITDRPEPAETTTQGQESVSYDVAIIAPATETSLPMGPGNFSVAASISPALEGSDLLQLNMDGEAWGPPQQGTNWALTNVFRGAHELSINILNGKGKTLTSSAPIRVYVHRPSINFRARN